MANDLNRASIDRMKQWQEDEELVTVEVYDFDEVIKVPRGGQFFNPAVSFRARFFLGETTWHQVSKWDFYEYRIGLIATKRVYGLDDMCNAVLCIEDDRGNRVRVGYELHKGVVRKPVAHPRIVSGDQDRHFHIVGRQEELL